MNKLKRYFLELRNKRKKTTENVGRENINYDKAKTIGILFSSENLENIESLANFIKLLHHDGKQVKALTYHDNQEKNNHKIYNFNHHVITEKDISFFGEIKSMLAEDFIKTNFDYLFCIDNKPSHVFQNILIQTKAKCRIGKFIDGQNNYELMIKINDNEGTDALIRQMYHYVKTIKND